MDFVRLANRFICVSKKYKQYTKQGKCSKCSQILYKLSNHLKPFINKTTKEDLAIICKFTKTNLAYAFDDTEFTIMLFQRNILLDHLDTEVLVAFESYIYTYGWKLESEQIKRFLEEQQIEKAAIFAISLELYKYGRQHEMIDEEISKMLIKLNLL